MIAIIDPENSSIANTWLKVLLPRHNNFCQGMHDLALCGARVDPDQETKPSEYFEIVTAHL